MIQNKYEIKTSIYADYELKPIVEQLCRSKIEEFELLGYQNVLAQDIWDCIIEKYREEIPALHQIVNDILSLKSTTFMSWLTLYVIKES